MDRCTAPRNRRRGPLPRSGLITEPSLPWVTTACAALLLTALTSGWWALVDGDRLRMLTVDEYRAAMGFPDGYQLPRPRHEAIHLLGNAICPPVAAAAVRAVMEVCDG